MIHETCNRRKLRGKNQRKKLPIGLAVQILQYNKTIECAEKHDWQCSQAWLDIHCHPKSANCILIKNIDITLHLVTIAHLMKNVWEKQVRVLTFCSRLIESLLYLLTVQCPNNARQVGASCQCIDSASTYNSVTNTCGESFNV